jgi:hypothetical protein
MGVRLAIAAFVVVSSAACGSPAAPDALLAEPTIAELRAAPTVATISGTRIELQAYLWRNFQPTVGPSRTGLNVIVRLSDVPTAVTIDRVWVVVGEQVWGTTPERLPGTAEWTARDGPTWDAGVAVDAVARLRALDGTMWLVRVADQRINSVV